MKTKRFISVLAAVCAVCILFSSAFSALAINVDYLNDQKWKSSENVTVEALDKNCVWRNNVYTLKGNFGYYADNSTMTLYTYFDISETTMKEGAQDVSVKYYFRFPGEDYTLTVDENGIKEYDTPDEEELLFKTASNFHASRNTFISAVQYTGREAYCKAAISLCVNGHIYSNIKEDIVLEKPSTTKPEATTKQKTTSKNKDSDKKGKTERETTTKFTPQGRITTTKGSKNKGSGSGSSGGGSNGSGEKYSADNTATSGKSSSKTVKGESGDGKSLAVEGNGASASGGITRLSNQALILILIAVVLATAGITLLITSAVIRNKKKEAESKTEDSEETNETQSASEEIEDNE